MTDRPILFSAPMVRALLAGTKTQTRRIVKPQPGDNNRITRSGRTINVRDPKVIELCRHGQVGDRLWVRETWTPVSVDAEEGIYTPDYRATANGQPVDGRWCPSIHMPRKAARITLDITAVRVERLQEISAADAIAEGISIAPHHPGMYEAVLADNGKGSRIVCAVDDPTEAYRALWNMINGSAAWDANPWVWVIQFKRCNP